MVTITVIPLSKLTGRRADIYMSALRVCTLQIACIIFNAFHSLPLHNPVVPSYYIHIYSFTTVVFICYINYIFFYFFNVHFVCAYVYRDRAMALKLVYAHYSKYYFVIAGKHAFSIYPVLDEESRYYCYRCCYYK